MRCSKCLLPAVLPGSLFDSNNECFWCRSGYPHYIPKGDEKLGEFLRPYRNSSGTADCLVGISGGKDSSFALLQLVKKFGLKAEAFTYNHGGMADFALENAINVCRKLGVKHHIVSLRDQAHIRSFRSFFKAWLKHPSSITAGLTCVACKHLHILGLKIAAERHIPLIVWSNCPLEYAPFIALKLKSTGDRQMTRGGIVEGGRLLIGEFFRSKELLISVIRHFRTCLYGCLAFSPTTKYVQLRFPQIQHVFFYDYHTWNPRLIVESLEKDVGWEKPVDVCDDWHSDCVFNVFKEYMFQKSLGASYTDSFLSSQVRYGIITRDEAWHSLVQSKNYYKQAISRALTYVGLDDLRDQIDTACFDIGEDLQ